MERIGKIIKDYLHVFVVTGSAVRFVVISLKVSIPNLKKDIGDIAKNLGLIEGRMDTLEKQYLAFALHTDLYGEDGMPKFPLLDWCRESRAECQAHLCSKMDTIKSSIQTIVNDADSSRTETRKEIADTNKK